MKEASRPHCFQTHIRSFVDYGASRPRCMRPRAVSDDPRRRHDRAHRFVVPALRVAEVAVAREVLYVPGDQVGGKGV